MKRINLTILLIISIFILSSCSFGGNKMSITDNSVQLADARFQQIVDALKNQDKDALKNMFSKQSLSEADNFDKELDSLFQYVQGSVQSWKSTGGSTFPEEWDADNHKKEAESTYVLTTSEQKYQIAVYEFTVDTANPNNVGVYSLCIINSKDNKDPNHVFWGNGKAGIIIGSSLQ